MALDREACERRVYRLATLLTGNPHTAVRVIEAVVKAQPDLRRLDSPRLDRLTILRCREIEPARLMDDAVPRPVAAALATMPAQPREAWVLTHAYRVPRRETARAMDCSVTATDRHLEHGEAVMAKALGNGADAAAGTVLDYSMALHVPGYYRQRVERRRRRRLVLMAVGLLSLVAGVLWVISWALP